MKEIILTCILCFFGCKTEKQRVPNEKTKEKTFKRLEIKGDFNGDGKQDVLKEIFISLIDGKEIPNFNKTDSYEELVGNVIKLDPMVSIKSVNMKEFILAKDLHLFGLLWLNNIGDINNDGTDEISVVINWADFSNINSCKILSYKNDMWKVLYQFTISESQMDWIEGKEKFKGFISKENGIYKISSFENGEIKKRILNIE